MKSNEKPGAHLQFGGPQLQRVRTFIQAAAQKHNIHPRLIGNFDQIWCTVFRPEKKCLQKQGSLRNIPRDPLSQSLYMRQIRHNLERALDLPLSEMDPKGSHKQDSRKEPQVQGMLQASSTVDGWRNPRTLTSLSFIDGAMGRGYLTFREGGISHATRSELNNKYGKYIFIAPPQPSSHVWSEASLIHYLDFVAQEVRIRRQELGVTASARALLMMDQAGAHMSRSYAQLQEKWCIQHNIVSWLHVLSVGQPE